MRGRMVAPVTQTATGVDLNSRLAAAGALYDVEGRPRSSGASRRRIGTPKANALVYELYALMPEEIKVVEGGATDGNG